MNNKESYPGKQLLKKDNKSIFENIEKNTDNIVDLVNLLSIIQEALYNSNSDIREMCGDSLNIVIDKMRDVNHDLLTIINE